MSQRYVTLDAFRLMATLYTLFSQSMDYNSGMDYGGNTTIS
jgi:hypothetical protein